MQSGNTKYIWELLNTVPDPEIPVISVVELGVIREVKFENDSFTISITPTYSGCPALKTMEEDIVELLNSKGYSVKIKTIFKPSWTTEWMTAETKEKLREYGIAPPDKLTFEHLLPLGQGDKRTVNCPFYSASNTQIENRINHYHLSR